MKKYLLCAVGLLMFASWGHADETVTPVSYIVSINELDFYNSTTGQWVTAGTGSLSFDLGATGSGHAAGNYVSGANLPSGTYTQMRCILSRTMQFKAYDTTTGWYTTTGQTTWNGGGDDGIGREIVIAQAAPAANAASLAQLGTMVAPNLVSGSQPAGESMSTTAGSPYQTETWSDPIFKSFSYTQGASKKLRISFGLTNVVSFYVPGSGLGTNSDTQAPTITIISE